MFTSPCYAHIDPGFDYTADRCLASDLGLHGALAIDLIYGCMRRGRLVREHHLIAVRRNLTACPLVQVSGALAGVRPARIARELHLMPHLNPTCLSHVCWHVGHLHQVLLVCHLKTLLLRFLVL